MLALYKEPRHVSVAGKEPENKGADAKLLCPLANCGSSLHTLLELALEEGSSAQYSLRQMVTLIAMESAASGPLLPSTDSVL